ncbi:MAG: hypothetical protein PT952_02175 [Eubacterium pyruvativorans]|nr:hypothetical protein [Eubacterium pyruvativorans]
MRVLVRIFNFLRIRTSFRTVPPENRGGTTDDGAENEKIPNPHPSDSDTGLIIGNNHPQTYSHTKKLYTMQSIEIIG